jgi:hypothetical protein
MPRAIFNNPDIMMMMCSIYIMISLFAKIAHCFANRIYNDDVAIKLHISPVKIAQRFANALWIFGIK